MTTGFLRLGRYRAEALLGQGGVTETYRGRRWDGGYASADMFALKVLRPDRGGDEPGVRAAFLEASHQAASVALPGFGRVVEVIDGPELAVTVSAFVPGLDLSRLRAGEGGAAPDAARIAGLGARIAERLAALHLSGVGPAAHGGLCPGNVLVASDGALTLVDPFIGAAVRPLAEHPIERWCFAAPELLVGDPVEPAADLYALGALLHFLLEGRPPFEAVTRDGLLERIAAGPPVIPGAPAALAEAIRALLASSPSARPPSAQAAARALDQAARAAEAYGVPIERRAAPAVEPWEPSPAEPPLAIVAVGPVGDARAVPVLEAPALGGLSDDLPLTALPEPSAVAPVALPEVTALPSVEALGTIDLVPLDGHAQESEPLVDLPAPLAAGDPEGEMRPTDSFFEVPALVPAPVMDLPSSTSAELLAADPPSGIAIVPAPLLDPDPVVIAQATPLEPDLPATREPLRGPLAPDDPTVGVVYDEEDDQPGAGAGDQVARRRTVNVALLPRGGAARRRGRFRWLPVASLVIVLAGGGGAAFFLYGPGQSLIGTAPVAAPPQAAPAPPPPPPRPRDPGALEIITRPAGAVVWVDGAEKGRSPLKLRTPPGGHRLVLVSPGYRMMREVVDTTDGVTVERTLSPATSPGEGTVPLSVVCQTKGKYPVFVDGKDTGTLCPSDGLKVAPGLHMIGVFVVPDNKIWSFERDVAPGPKPHKVIFSY